MMLYIPGDLYYWRLDYVLSVLDHTRRVYDHARAVYDAARGIRKPAYVIVTKSTAD
jgi:hypothetical protein